MQKDEGIKKKVKKRCKEIEIGVASSFQPQDAAQSVSGRVLNGQSELLSSYGAKDPGPDSNQGHLTILPPFPTYLQ